MSQKRMLWMGGSFLVLLLILSGLRFLKEKQNWEVEEVVPIKKEKMLEEDILQVSEDRETKLLYIEEESRLKEKFEDYDSFYWELETWLQEQNETRRRVFCSIEGDRVLITFLHEDISKDFQKIKGRKAQGRWKFSYE